MNKTNNTVLRVIVILYVLISGLMIGCPVKVATDDDKGNDDTSTSDTTAPTVVGISAANLDTGVTVTFREPLFTPFGKIEVPSAHDVRLIFGNFSCKNG